GGIECFRIGTSFEKLDEATRSALEVIIEDCARGPATLARKPEEVDDDDPPGTSRGISLSDRRRETRGAYSQTIPAFGERALRVLVGRGLWGPGMRGGPQPEFWIGDRLQLAIYGAASEPPMLIWGQVERSDGDRGVLVRFEPLDPATQARLERLVA